MSDKKPTWESVINHAIASRLARVRVCMPGRIEKFDPETQLADVKPLIHDTVENLDGETESYALPLIYNVPVIFEGTSNFYLTYPISVGDRCELRFADRALDNWMTQGDDLNPEETRRHDLTDAICVMGLRDQAHKITEFDNNRPAMGKRNAPKIAFEDDAVSIGGSHNEILTDFAALASLVKDRLDKIQSTVDQLITHYAAHVHTSDGVPAVPPFTSSIGPLSSVAASKVKVK